MIKILLFLLLVLSILIYLTALYLEWKTEKINHEEDLESINKRLERFKRDIRKGYYFTNRKISDATKITTKVAENLFFKVFPSARNAFREYDKMTGLKKGPSSYFLHELSQVKPIIKIRRKNKSM